MLEVREIISYGERTFELIKKSSLSYRNENTECAYLVNLAIYTLDYESYYDLSLKYSQAAIKLAAINKDATRALQAKIMYQIACFKLKNENFSKQKLLALLKAFKLLEWHKEYIRLERFIEKHGILLTNDYLD